VKRTLALTPELLQAYSRRGNFHSDPGAAAELGYTKLVAQGMQVAGPAYGLLLDEWGEDFLAHGTVELKFVSACTDGETVDATVDIDGTRDAATITVANATTGATAVVGTAHRDGREAA
jgi:acyl dehydratase